MANTILRKLAGIKTDLRQQATAAIEAGDYPQLLTSGADSKTVKGERFGVQTFIMYLAPAQLSGKNVCRWSSTGCVSSCLFTAGRGGMISSDENKPASSRATVAYARMKRTMFWHLRRDEFMLQLHREIERGIKSAARGGMLPAFRLNGTSDIEWEDTGILEDFKTTQFYDYTKGAGRAKEFGRGHLPCNYHLTLSRSEDMSDDTVRGAVASGVNVAVVFSGTLPESWLGIPVMDGDLSDVRFADKSGHIVGLKAKGVARSDLSSGFVVAV
jgi:hypothetical protein